MFEGDNQDHEDQRRELLTLLRATTVITTCPWIFMGYLLARYGGKQISHCHWSCYDSVETNMLKMVMILIESSTHNSSIEPDEGGNKQH